MRIQNPLRLLTPALTAFMAGMVLANIAGAMNQSLLPLYVQSLGADARQIGLFFSLGAVAPLAFQILGGYVSDSIGRLRAVAIGSVAGCMGYAVYLLAPSWGWLMVGHMVGSLSVCFVAPSFDAFIAEQSTENTRARVFAMAESIYAVVGIVGPPIGGFFVQRYGFRAMIAVAVALYLLATALRINMAARVREDASRPRFGLGGVKLSGLRRNLGTIASMLLAGGVMTWLFLSDCASDIAFTVTSRFEPIYEADVIGLRPLQITWVISSFSVVRMLVLPLGGAFADRLGERAGLCLGHLLCGIGAVLFLLGAEFADFVAVSALYGTGSALFSPAYQSLVSKEVPAKVRGTAYGLISTSLGIASLPAPYVGGLMWERFGPRAPFFLPLVTSFAMAVLLWFKLPARGGAGPGRTAGASSSDTDLHRLR
ncbi:MAG: MFS transporter [Firmicutes bacterium]|nr:MFS transporter [Bacillota bacterium]